MLHRVLESEVMDNPSQVRAYADADLSSSEINFINLLEKKLRFYNKTLKPGDLVLDIGCGPGNITKRILKRWPNIEIIGVDPSFEMIDLAIKETYKSSLSEHIGNITYLNIGFNEIEMTSSLLKGYPDLIISNSFLHHLHNPNRFWAKCAAISSSQTLHFHMDLRRPVDLDEALRLQMKYLPYAPKCLIKDYLSFLT